MPERKALTGLKVIDEAAGTVRAVFATLNVIDKDGEVTLAGEFRDGQKVRISAYNHKSWEGALPVGRGQIAEEGDLAILTGKFFLNTVAGQETFTVVKELGELAEWSYGFDAQRKRGVFGPADTPVTFLSDIEVHEVSPVILGAGIDTRTLEMKAAKQMQSDLFARLRDAGRARWAATARWVWVEDFDVDLNTAIFCVESETEMRHVRVAFSRGESGTITLETGETEVQPATVYTPKGRKLSDHVGLVVAEFDVLVTRVAEVKASRVEKGKHLGADTMTALEQFEVKMKRLRDVLANAPQTDDLQVLVAREAARFEQLRSSL